MYIVYSPQRKGAPGNAAACRREHGNIPTSDKFNNLSLALPRRMQDETHGDCHTCSISQREPKIFGSLRRKFLNDTRIFCTALWLRLGRRSVRGDTNAAQEPR